MARLEGSAKIGTAMTAKTSEPTVTGPNTKNSGKYYRLGRTPKRTMALHNAVRCPVIEAIRGSATMPPTAQ